jgi:HEAT repeat protein
MPNRETGLDSQMPQAETHNPLAARLLHLPDTMGREAIPELVTGLHHQDPWVRLHAAEGLAKVDDPEARAALATALHDPSFGVHWAAGRALAAAGRDGVVAALRALLHDIPSTVLLHGVAYVLRHAALSPAERAAVSPVQEALQRPAADLEAPIAALEALDHLAVEPPTPLEREQPWYRWRRSRRTPWGYPFPIPQSADRASR